MEMNIGYGKDFVGIASPFTVKIDKSLSKQGQAADAKSTGKLGEDILVVLDEAEARIDESVQRAERAAESAQQSADGKQDKLNIFQEVGEQLIANSIYFVGTLSNNIDFNFPETANLGDTITIMYEQINTEYQVNCFGTFIGLTEELSDTNVHTEIDSIWDGNRWVCKVHKITL